ncbi:MbtH family protein [Duganella sp. S19_KUP01_CR8]|uniref:MbtH family protein n=1 Tax=Duganella sp. S19_KUP01_CR8 TaxID=3025502 RepID=UPI002FCD8A85
MQQERLYEVVINAERQYSVWPAQRPVPEGWLATGFRATRELCLAHIDTVWQDLREHSLQLALAGGELRHG